MIRLRSIGFAASSFFAACALATLSVPLHATLAAAPEQAAGHQPPAPPPAVAAIKRLDFLQGRWEGTGWIQMGPQRATFRQEEMVRTAAGGTVLIIDGLGRSADEGQKGRVVHQAFGVLSFDAARQAFRWRAYRADGQEVEATPEVSENRFVWGFEGNGMKVRFTITKTDAGEWLEIGEMTRPGTAEPFKFFEMTLRRVGDAR